MIIDVRNTNVLANYWSQERVVLRGTANVPVKFWSSLYGSQNDPIAIYTPDENHAWIIDVTDYLRTYNNQIGGVITFYVKLATLVIPAIQLTNAGLINPEGVLIPSHFSEADLLICPPSKMIQAGDLGTIIYEIRNVDQYGEFAYSEIDASGHGLADDRVYAPFKSHECEEGTASFTLSTNSADGTYELAPQECGKTYCLVEWVSFTGVKRRHVLEVRKQKTSSDGAFDLLGLDNEYIKIKGRVDGFSLFMGELDAYDVWYYYDIITSSDVRVSFDGTNWARVDVTAKNYTLPDGDAEKNNKIEIAINWKKYDSVAM